MKYKVFTLIIALLLGVLLLNLSRDSESMALDRTPESLQVPKNNIIRVAFVLEEGATMIDFAGPWEVFQDVMVTSEGKPMRTMNENDMVMPFQLFTVAETKQTRRTSGGLQFLPDYTYDNAPLPNIVVVPAQGRSAKRKAWLQTMKQKADVILSVCTGAFVLADAGLLDGKKATTHHWFHREFQQRFPNVQFQKTARFVDNGKIVTAAGLSSGIDAALHIVQRYYGRDVAQATADYMEYHSTLF
jgi:transcriptional regulator GlxA family with amidase domain